MSFGEIVFGKGCYSFVDNMEPKIYYPNIEEITRYRLKELTELGEELGAYIHETRWNSSDVVTNNIKLARDYINRKQDEIFGQ